MSAHQRRYKHNVFRGSGRGKRGGERSSHRLASHGGNYCRRSLTGLARSARERGVDAVETVNREKELVAVHREADGEVIWEGGIKDLGERRD